MSAFGCLNSFWTLDEQEDLARFSLGPVSLYAGGSGFEQGGPRGGKKGQPQHMVSASRMGRNPHPNHPGKIFAGNLPNDISKEVLHQVGQRLRPHMHILTSWSQIDHDGVVYHRCSICASFNNRSSCRLMMLTTVLAGVLDVRHSDRRPRHARQVRFGPSMCFRGVLITDGGTNRY